MIKKIFSCVLVLSIVSCGGGDTENVTPSGYKYTHNKIGTEKLEAGDYVEFGLRIQSDKGEVLQDAMDVANLPTLQLPTAESPSKKTDPLTEALALACVGDTIVVTMPMDSLPPSAKADPKLKGSAYIEYVAVVKAGRSEAEQKARVEEQRLEMEATMEADKARMSEVEKLVADKLPLIKKGKLESVDMGDGLKFYSIEEGTGAQAETGKRVSVHYYGVDMDGNMFDSSFKAGRPYPLTIGAGRVIRGWDQGLPALKKGGKGLLHIPYQLAYGEAGSPPVIGKKADLLFYVELVELN